jgi:hypothetical protein
LDRYSRHALRHHTPDVGSSDARKVLHAHVAHIREPARRSRGAVQERASPRLSGSYPVVGGAGLATVNWIVAALVTLTVIAAYRYRINAEERMLVASFGEQYEAYMKHKCRLLPFVW